LLKQGRLSLRLDKALLRDIQELADRRNVTLTGVVERYFRELLRVEQAERELERPEEAEQI
jgi:hypothetical protein